jgi:multidrug resistance efflux pump
MLEFLLCSLVTILPDYLFRRRVQGKQWGRELNIYSIWYELRWGLTTCAVLTVSLLTMIFYYHPSTTNVTSIFRTVTILPEAGGRVAEVHVENQQQVTAGQPLFRLDDSSQQTAVETARRQVQEIDAAQVVALSELAAAQGMIEQAEGLLNQARTELQRNRELAERNPNVVAAKELDRLENLVDSREGALNAATANLGAVNAKIETLLPAQKASAEAALAQAEVNLAKTVVYAGTAGTIQQFALQVGDFVSPVLRPAGILIPEGSGRGRFQAGFDQLSAQVVRRGVVGEITCFSKPFTIIPVVVTDVQNVIAAGQLRPTDVLRGVEETARPGTLTVAMEPLFAGDADDVPPGSKCIANAYTSFHDRLDDPGIGIGTWLFYHAVDATAVVHAAILRIQALLLPVQTLVFSGH